MDPNDKIIAAANFINSNPSTKEVETNTINTNNSSFQTGLNNDVKKEMQSRNTKNSVIVRMTPLKSKPSSPHSSNKRRMSLPLQTIEENLSPFLSTSGKSSSTLNLNDVSPLSRLSTASSPFLLPTFHPPPSMPPPPPPFKPPSTPPSMRHSKSPWLSKAGSTSKISKKLLGHPSKHSPPLPSAHSSPPPPSTYPPPPIPPRPFPPNQLSTHKQRLSVSTAKTRRQSNLKTQRPTYPRTSSLATNKLDF